MVHMQKGKVRVREGWTLLTNEARTGHAHSSRLKVDVA